MNITLNKHQSNEASIKVSLQPEDYKSQVDKKIKDYSKQAQVKGFRPGKVPVALIHKMYGKSILVEEINDVVSKALQNHIKENNIQILGEPVPDQQSFESIDWETQENFDFTYRIGLVDEFEVDLSKKLKLTHYEIDVNDKVIDETVDNLKEQFSSMTNPEISEAGDILFGTLKQKNGDIEHDSTIDPSNLSKTNAKKLIGQKSGDSLDIDLSSFYKDKEEIATLLKINTEEIDGQDMKFTFHVKNVNRKVPAEVNQELFDKTFGPDNVKSEKEFRAKIADTVRENYQRETAAWLNKTVQDTLVDKTKITLPESFLKDWLKLSSEGKVTDADIEQEFDMYANQLKWNLISNKIAELNELKTEHEDILAATRKMIEAQFQGSGLGQMADQMDSFVEHYLQGEKGQNYMKMAEQVQEEKVLEHIKSAATLNDKKISLDKFKEIVGA